MSLFHSHKMRLLDLNVLLQAEMTDLPTFSYTWNLKRYSFWMRPHRLGHHREFLPWVLNSMNIKREVQKRLQSWSYQSVFDTRLQTVSCLLKYSFLRVGHDVYHACSNATRRNKRWLPLRNAPSQEGLMGTIRYDTIRHDTINTIPYNTIQYNKCISVITWDRFAPNIPVGGSCIKRMTG